MADSACKLWIPSRELEILLGFRRSKRHNYEPLFQKQLTEVKGSGDGLYSAELVNEGYMALLQRTYVLARVGHEILREGHRKDREEAHIFAIVSSRQGHTAYPCGLVLTTHPELDRISNHGFEAVEINLPTSGKPGLDQFVMEAHAAYSTLLQQSHTEQAAIKWQRSAHILFYTVTAQHKA